MPVDPSRPNPFQALLPKVAAAKIAEQRVLHAALEGAREDLTQTIIRTFEDAVQRVADGLEGAGQPVTIDFNDLLELGSWREGHPDINPQGFDNRGLGSLRTMSEKANDDEAFGALFREKVCEPVKAELLEAGFVEPHFERIEPRNEQFVDHWGQWQNRFHPGTLQFSVRLP